MRRAISKAAIAFWLIAAAVFPAAIPAHAASGGAPPVPLTLEAAMALAAAGKLKDAYAIYRRLAAAGNAEAMYRLAEAHRTGQAIPIDLPEAICWYLKAAAKGHKTAQRRIIEITFYFGHPFTPGGRDEADTYDLYFVTPNADYLYLHGDISWRVKLPVVQIHAALMIELAARQGHRRARLFRWWKKSEMDPREYAAAIKLADAWHRGDMKKWAAILLRTP